MHVRKYELAAVLLGCRIGGCAGQAGRAANRGAEAVRKARVHEKSHNWEGQASP